MIIEGRGLGRIGRCNDQARRLSFVTEGQPEDGGGTNAKGSGCLPKGKGSQGHVLPRCPIG